MRESDGMPQHGSPTMAEIMHEAPSPARFAEEGRKTKPSDADLARDRAAAAAAAQIEMPILAARAQAKEAEEGRRALELKHERLSTKVTELMELERTFGGGGREALYKERVQQLTLELRAAQEALRETESVRKLENAQMTRAVVEAERDATYSVRKEMDEKLHKAHEEGAAFAQESGNLAVSVAKDIAQVSTLT